MESVVKIVSLQFDDFKSGCHRIIWVIPHEFNILCHFKLLILKLKEVNCISDADLHHGLLKHFLEDCFVYHFEILQSLDLFRLLRGYIIIAL